MARRWSLLLLIVALVAVDDAAERANATAGTGGMFWSTAKEEEANLLRKEDPKILDDRDDIDGGFSSLDGMLQWAIGHSDPAKLKETAPDVRGMSDSELKKRRVELNENGVGLSLLLLASAENFRALLLEPLVVSASRIFIHCLALDGSTYYIVLREIGGVRQLFQHILDGFYLAFELLETLKMPSDAQLIQIVIGDLITASLPVEDQLRALQEMLILVEPADNANDLNKLGGLAVIIRELDHPEFDVRKLLAWVIGKASQNNPLVQNQVLELGALAKLMLMVKSEFVKEAIKALYAVSALIRNNLSGQELFYAEAGDLIILDILSNATVDVRLRRKVGFHVGDLAEFQLEAAGEGEIPFFRNRHLLNSVVGLMASSDLDLQEKEFCGLDVALERMRQLLDHLIGKSSQRCRVVFREEARNDAT